MNLLYKYNECFVIKKMCFTLFKPHFAALTRLAIIPYLVFKFAVRNKKGNIVGLAQLPCNFA